MIECAWQGVFSLDFIHRAQAGRAPSSGLELHWSHIVGSLTPAQLGKCCENIPEHIHARAHHAKGSWEMWNSSLQCEALPLFHLGACLMFIPAPSVTSSSNVVHLRILNEICVNCQLCSSNLLSKKSSCVLSAPSVIPSPCWQGAFRMETWLLTRRLKHGMGTGMSCTNPGGEKFPLFIKKSNLSIPNQALF